MSGGDDNVIPPSMLSISIADPIEATRQPSGEIKPDHEPASLFDRKPSHHVAIKLSPLIAARIQRTLTSSRNSPPAIPNITPKSVSPYPSAPGLDGPSRPDPPATETTVPITPESAKDLLDRGLYRLSTDRYSKLVDADPKAQQYRRLSSISSIMSHDYWGPVVPRIWSKFLRTGSSNQSNDHLPELVATEFATILAQDGDDLYRSHKLYGAVFLLDMSASIGGSTIEHVIEGQSLTPLGLAHSLRFDERYGPLVSTIMAQLKVDYDERVAKRLSPFIGQLDALQRSMAMAREDSAQVSLNVRNLIDMGRLFNAGDQDSADIAELCFDYALNDCDGSPNDIAYVERSKRLYRMEFMKTKSDLMENQRQVMHNFMAGVALLRKGNLVSALSDLSKTVQRFPDNAAFFAKAVEARSAYEAIQMAKGLQQVAEQLPTDYEPESQWLLSISADLLESNIAGLVPVAIKEGVSEAREIQAAHGEAKKQQLQIYELRKRGEELLMGGEFQKAAMVYEEIGQSANNDHTLVQSIIAAIKQFDRDPAKRSQSISTLRVALEKRPLCEPLAKMAGDRTREYLCGRLYAIWRGQALHELHIHHHAAIGLIMLQQARPYAADCRQPELVDDLSKLIQSASDRAESEAVLADESYRNFVRDRSWTYLHVVCVIIVLLRLFQSSPNAIVEASKRWVDSVRVIGGPSIPPAPYRGAGSRTNIAALLSSAQIAIDNDRLQTASRLINQALSIDPNNIDIRKQRRLIDSSMRNRDQGRREYLMALEAIDDCSWAQAHKRLRNAIHYRPCSLYSKQLERTQAMITAQSKDVCLRKKISELIGASQWMEARDALDTLMKFKANDTGLEKLRVLIECGIEDDEYEEKRKKGGYGAGQVGAIK